MQLTSFTDYGFRMLMRMASAPDRAFSTAELAEEFKLSRNHLTKIMQRLAQGGIVETRRGVSGGARLRRDPGEIRLGDVVRLLEQGQALVECFRPDGEQLHDRGLLSSQGPAAPCRGPLCRGPEPIDPRGYRVARTGRRVTCSGRPG